MISVLMRSHNDIKYIKSTVEALLTQDIGYNPINIIRYLPVSLSNPAWPLPAHVAPYRPLPCWLP